MGSSSGKEEEKRTRKKKKNTRPASAPKLSREKKGHAHSGWIDGVIGRADKERAWIVYERLAPQNIDLRYSDGEDLESGR